MKNISIIFVLLFVFFSCEEKNNINENTELNNNIPDTILLEDKTKGLRPPLVASYHPSQQNTNTGKLTAIMMTDVFRQVRTLLK